MINKLKQLFCKHSFKPLGKEVLLGITVNWALKLTNEYEDTYKCSKCGLEEKRKYIYFGGVN